MSVTILIAEDESEERDALATWLLHKGYQVTVARDGGEALRLLSGDDPLPSLVLLDLEMPVVDGWRVLARIALNPAWRRLPVIVTSGRLSGSEHIECPTVAFAPKPLRPEGLATLIETLLDADPDHDDLATPIEMYSDEPTEPHEIAPESWKPADGITTARMATLPRRHAGAAPASKSGAR